MRTLRWDRCCPCRQAVALVLVAGTLSVAAQEYGVTTGHVVVVCPLTVGGRFEARTEAITGSATLREGSPDVSGSFTVDLRTLETGIALRNAHLRENYLEVGRGAGFDAAVLELVRLDTPDASVANGTVGFRGQFTLHGQTRPVAGTVEISRRKSDLQLDVSFPLRIDDFRITRPTYLGVGVSNDIKVEVKAILERRSS